jgi:hypothetical protein
MWLRSCNPGENKAALVHFQRWLGHIRKDQGKNSMSISAGRKIHEGEANVKLSIK